MNACAAPDPLGRSLVADPFGRSLAFVGASDLTAEPGDSGRLGRSLAVVLSVLAALTAVVRIAGSVWPIASRSMRPFLDISVWAAERRVRGWLGARTWRRARFWSRAKLDTLARGAGLRVADARGSVHFPPIALAARLVEPFEPVLTRLRAPGAAFLALAGDKPELPS